MNLLYSHMTKLAAQQPYCRSEVAMHQSYMFHRGSVRKTWSAKRQGWKSGTISGCL